jgi:hypothetical protein
MIGLGLKTREVFISFERLRSELSVHYFPSLITDTNLDLPVLSAKLSLIQLKSGYIVKTFLRELNQAVKLHAWQ